MSITAPYSSAYPGLFCTAHRSIYCEHIIEALKEREDASSLEQELISRASGQILAVTVPIYPDFCVWESVEYTVSQDKVFGPHGRLVSPAADPVDGMQAIAQLMAGDSAADLGMVLRQNFEDGAEEMLGNLQADMQRNSRHPLPWQCKGRKHGVKYQNSVREILSADSIAHAMASENMSTQYAILYTFMTYNWCLFCWVNDTKRDAVRVNPYMSAMFPDAAESKSNYDDLVPF